MSLYAEIDLHPSRAELFKFGLTFLVGTGLIGLACRFALDRPDVALRLWIAGPLVLALSLVPRVGRLLYVLWMGLGLTIGAVTSPILLFVVYVLLVVPVGIVFKLRRRDAMKRALDARAETYWEEYPPGDDDPRRYVRQF